MANPASDAVAAATAAGKSAAAQSDDRKPRPAPTAEHSASGDGAVRDAASTEEAPLDGGDVGDSELIDRSPRTNLSQDAITQLRAQHKHLKKEQKRVRQEMKNTTRKRQRVLARMRHLDTASVLQVLVERGVQLGPPASVPPPATSPPERPAAKFCCLWMRMWSSIQTPWNGCGGTSAQIQACKPFSAVTTIDRRRPAW